MKKIAIVLLITAFAASALSACSLLPGFTPVQRATESAPTPTVSEPEPTAPATEAPTDAPVGTLSDYVRTAKERTVDFGDSAVTMRLPEIMLDGQDADEANDEIMERFGDVVDSGADYTGANTLDYEAYLNDRVLSVVITSRYDGGNSYGLCYSFDVTTAERLDSEALCTLLDRSYSDSLDALYDHLVSYYEEKYSTLPGNDTEKEKTYSYSNLKSAVMYLDGDGDLTVLVDIYAAVGGGHWVAQIEID